MNKLILFITYITICTIAHPLLAQNGTVKTTTTINRSNSGLNAQTLAIGNSSVAISDLDGDGYRELAIGASSDISGVVIILFMNANGTVKRHTVLGRNIGGVNIEGLTGSFSTSLAYLGDVNNDGIGDILVGDANYPPNVRGGGNCVFR
jgi:hypothetical protein